MDSTQPGGDAWRPVSLIRHVTLCVLFVATGYGLVGLILWGAVAGLETLTGSRRAAVASTAGVYLGVAALLAAVLIRGRLRSWPPQLWEPGDRRRFVSWVVMSLLGSLAWPVVFPVMFVIESVEDYWVRRRRLKRRRRGPGGNGSDIR